MPPGVSPLCEAGLAACHDVFQGSWSWAKGTCWILTIPLMEVLWWWKHIICCSHDEAVLACFHFPQHFLADLPLLHTFPLHPLPLFGKRDCLGTSCGLLLSAHLPDHQCPPLWCCDLSASWFTCDKAKASSSLVDLPHDVFVPQSWCCLLYCVRCAATLMVLSPESLSVIWSLTLEHLYSSVRLVRGSSRTPLP